MLGRSFCVCSTAGQPGSVAPRGDGLSRLSHVSAEAVEAGVWWRLVGPGQQTRGAGAARRSGSWRRPASGSRERCAIQCGWCCAGVRCRRRRTSGPTLARAECHYHGVGTPRPCSLDSPGCSGWCHGPQEPGSWAARQRRPCLHVSTAGPPDGAGPVGAHSPGRRIELRPRVVVLFPPLLSPLFHDPFGKLPPVFCTLKIPVLFCFVLFSLFMLR